MKTQEIVLYKNPTFIGPTTGIMGIYHGAWWYYFLSLAFIIFNGLPQGFAYLICIFYFLSGLLFYFFLKKELGYLSAVIFLILFGFSPYLIFISTFVINSGFTIPFIFLLFFSLYQFLKEKNKKYLFLIFLSAGFIFETQVSFGLFLIPSLILSLIIITDKKLLFNLKSIVFGFGGLFFPLLPRILFEVKNNFLQTKTFLNYLFHPKYYNSRSLNAVLIERINLFIDFYFKIFNSKILAIIFFIFIVFYLSYFFKRLKKFQQKFVFLNVALVFFIFFLSLFYKDSFWPNYLEGFSLFYLFFIDLAFYLAIRYGGYVIKFISIILPLIILIFNLNKFIGEIRNKKIIINGLIKQQKVIEKLYKENNYQQFCLRIYTPPVIPYTYQYLIEYYSRVKKYQKPKEEYINNQCWYVIEDDSYKFRINEWKKQKISLNSEKIKFEKIFNDITIELWKEK